MCAKEELTLGVHAARRGRAQRKPSLAHVVRRAPVAGTVVHAQTRRVARARRLGLAEAGVRCRVLVAAAVLLGDARPRRGCGKSACEYTTSTPSLPLPPVYFSCR